MLNFFNKDELDAVSKPCVYQFLDENKLPLYIGYSQYGYARVFNRPPVKNLYTKNRLKAVETASFLDITFFDSAEEARVREKELIHNLHPQYNRCAICWKQTKEKQVIFTDRVIAANCIRYRRESGL